MNTVMKKTPIALAFALLAAPTLAADMAPGLYQYDAGKSTTPIVIDGKLDEAAWQSTAWTRNFVLHNNGAPAASGTWAKIAYDDEAVYIAFKADDADIAASYTQHDDPVFRHDDAMEIFIDPDGNGLNYYEIGVTAYTAYDYVIKSLNPMVDDQGWNAAGLSYAVQVMGTLNDATDVDEGTITEIRLPFAALNYPDSGYSATPTSWRFNVNRAEYNTAAPIWSANEWLAWSPIGSFGFHQPEKFGTLNFTGVDLWQAELVYRTGERVMYNGLPYEATQYLEGAVPGQAEGWRLVAAGPQPWSNTQTYQKGDQVTYGNGVWQAKWWTLGDIPGEAPVWEQQQ